MFTIKQGDTSPSLEVQLTNQEDEPVDLRLADRVEIHVNGGVEADDIVDDTSGNLSFLNKEKGKVQYTWRDGETSVSGQREVEFVVFFSNGKQETFPNRGFVYIQIQDDISSL